MGFVLDRDISFCSAGDRVIFLDLGQDRYFCLRRGAEAAFRKLVAKETLTPADEAELLGAGAGGWLLPGGENRPVPAACAAAPPVSSSALECGDIRPDLLRLPSILSQLAIARLDLRKRSLHAVIRHLENRKAAVSPALA